MGYPNGYIGGLSCYWMIYPPPAKEIRLTFHDFELQTEDESGVCHDFLEVSILSTFSSTFWTYRLVDGTIVYSVSWYNLLRIKMSIGNCWAKSSTLDLLSSMWFVRHYVHVTQWKTLPALGFLSATSFNEHSALGGSRSLKQLLLALKISCYKSVFTFPHYRL